jgi:hypothetical protein
LADSNLAYKYAVTTDLQFHLEAVYGSSSLTEFLMMDLQSGYPSYTVTQKIKVAE